MIEVESYRLAAARVVGRRIVSVDANDDWYLKKATTPGLLTAVLSETLPASVRRIGKLLLMDVAETSGADVKATIGMRFGMTGRLVVDGVCDLGELLYSSHRNDPKFTRFALGFDDGGTLEISDPRRLGGIELDPDVSELGVDALCVSLEALTSLLRGSKTTLKARLLDQGRIAGIGNLIADELLWQARLAPNRSASSLSPNDVSTLHSVMRSTIVELTSRGGSHLGDLMTSRGRGSLCPRCGTGLSRDTVGGRTTYWCPIEQI